jgi:hypothetical protein
MSPHLRNGKLQIRSVDILSALSIPQTRCFKSGMEACGPDHLSPKS